jgi:hypothetical protein
MVGGGGITSLASSWFDEPALDGLRRLGPGWGRHSPRSDDALYQSFLLPILIVFIVFFPFTVPAFVVFFAPAFDFAAVFAFALDLAFALDPTLTSTAAFAVTSTLTRALALTVTREYATPPTKLATEPSRNTVFAKLVQTSILSRVSILYSPGRIQRRLARGPSVADPAQGARFGRMTRDSDIGLEFLRRWYSSPQVVIWEAWAPSPGSPTQGLITFAALKFISSLRSSRPRN